MTLCSFCKEPAKRAALVNGLFVGVCDKPECVNKHYERYGDDPHGPVTLRIIKKEDTW